jgi:polysaccharide biosynthesis/export protein
MSSKYYCLFLYFLFYGSVFSQVEKLPGSLQRAIKNSGIPRSQIEKLINDNKNLIPSNTDIKSSTRSNEKIDNTQAEITKIKQSINQINQDDSVINDFFVGPDNISSNNETSENPLGASQNKDDDKVLKTESVENKSLDSTEFEEDAGIEYFGYNIFKENPSVFQKSTNTSIDPNYIVGPGDEIILMLWGETEINDSYVVSIEGYLFIDNIGQIFVNGLTMEKLEQKLFKLLRKVYSSIGAPSESNAKTFFDLSLGSLSNRPLRVFVLGEVSQPGAYSINSSATLFSSLFYFDGPTTNGSLRDVRLIRDGKIIKKIDFYDYLLRGEKVNDEKLQRDDIIFIPLRGKTVSINGEVKKPAIFELQNTESFEDLLSISGGLKNSAYTKRAQIDRVIGPADRKKDDISRTIIDFSLNEYIFKKDKKLAIDLYDGDRITVFKISDLKNNIISVTGAVNRPGDYQITKNMTIVDLVEKADGVRGDAFLQKVDIFRQNDNFTRNQITIDLTKAFEGDNNNNVFLSSSDSIIVYSFNEMLDVFNVTIEGHVLNPGVQLYYEGMTLYDLVFNGGGFKNDRHLKNTYFERADLYRASDSTMTNKLISFNLDSLLSNNSDFNMKLVSGDRVVIYSNFDIFGDLSKSVIIEGLVKRPGEYELTSNLSLKQLFFIAAGFDDLEFFKGVFKDRVDILRKGKIDQDQILSFNLSNILNDIIDVPLEDKDVVTVYSKSSFELNNEVSIDGEIINPGSYALGYNMTIGDLILAAGGLTPDIVKFRAEVSRIDGLANIEGLLSDIYTFDITNTKKVFYSKIDTKNKLNFKLQPSDIVIVRSAPLNAKQDKVTILGFVNYPGDYIIAKSEEKVSSLINRAGGLKEEAYVKASSLKRNGVIIRLSFEKILKNPRSKFNFSVLAGDTITINSRPNLVIVDGEVNNPGNYQYFRGNSMNSYIKLAGGMTRDASRYSSFITYPDGTTKRLSYFTPTAKVYDGSILTIGRKEDVEPFSLTQYAINLTEIYSEFLQLYLLLTLSSNNSN